MLLFSFFFTGQSYVLLQYKISFNVLKYKFLISAGGMVCGRDLGRG